MHTLHSAMTDGVRVQRKTLKSGVMADITRSATIIADTYPTFEDFNAASSKSKVGNLCSCIALM